MTLYIALKFVTSRMTNFFFRRMISKTIRNIQNTDFWEKNIFFRDNLTSSSINGFFWSNFASFGFAPQIQFLIYSSPNGLLWSNFKIFFTMKNAFVKNHYSAYSWSFWRSFDEKKKFVTRDVTNFSLIPYILSKVKPFHSRSNQWYFVAMFVIHFGQYVMKRRYFLD